MPYASESQVIVAPDSSGKAIRNLQITALVANTTTGVLTPTTIQMQVTAISDEYGNIIDTDYRPTLEEILTVLRRQYALLRIMAEALTDDTSGRHSICTEDELLDPEWNAEQAGAGDN